TVKIAPGVVEKNRNQPVRLGIGQGPQHDPVDQGEHGAGRADPERQREYRDTGEGPRLPQHARGHPQIVEQAHAGSDGKPDAPAKAPFSGRTAVSRARFWAAASRKRSRRCGRDRPDAELGYFEERASSLADPATLTRQSPIIGFVIHQPWSDAR